MYGGGTLCRRWYDFLGKVFVYARVNKEFCIFGVKKGGNI